MRTVRVAGDDDAMALVVASMPERYRLAGDADGDADIVLVTATTFVDDGRAVPALWFAPRLADVASVPDAVLADVTVEYARLSELDAVVEALAVARVLVGPVDDVDALHRSDRCVLIVAGIATITVIASAVGRDALHARVTGRTTRVEAEIDASSPARPAMVRTFTDGGEHVAPLVHQSAVRLTLQRVADGAPLPYTRDELARDLGVARRLL